MTSTTADRDLAQQLLEVADDGGTIQAEDMVPLTSDPTMHTACALWRAARHLGVEADLADLLGCTSPEVP